MLDRMAAKARQQNVLSTVMLELTYQCNLDCTFCYNDLNLKGKRLSLEQYKTLLDDLADMNVMMLTLSGGEPLMYPHFFELGAHARQRGFLVTVKSNAVPLNQNNAQRLREEVDPYLVETSLHGACAETHDKLTRVDGSFDRLLKNVRILRSLGIKVQLNSTLTCWNEGEVEDMLDLADELGIILRFNTEVSPRDDGDMSPLALAPTAEGKANMFRLTLERVRAKQQAGPVPLKAPAKPGSEVPPAPGNGTPAPNKICGAGSTYLTIDPFGTVLPCVQYRRAAGNLHRQSIREIWEHSADLQDVRRTAERAHEIALGAGIGQFCMGLSELHHGDPLVITESALDTGTLFKRLNWEVFGGEDAA